MPRPPPGGRCLCGGIIGNSISASQIIDTAVNLSGRPRLKPESPALIDGDAVLQPNESMVLFVELEFDSASEIPQAIVHQLAGSAATNPGSSYPLDVEYLMVPQPGPASGSSAVFRLRQTLRL